MSRASVSSSSSWSVSAWRYCSTDMCCISGELGSAAKRGERRAELVRERGAELPHLADGLLEPAERVVEGVRHLVELVLRAAQRQPPVRGRRRRSRRVAAAMRDERRERPRRHPAADDQREQQPRRHAPRQQAHEALQRVVDRRQRDADLQQVRAAVARATARLLDSRMRP